MEGYKKYIYTYLKENSRLALIFLFYTSLLFFSYWAFYLFDIFSELPTRTNLRNWDAYWYTKIKNEGYQFSWDEPSSSAFFPFFPYVWKLLHLNQFGICILNFLIYLLGLQILFKRFQFSLSKIILYMSVPSSIFFFLPYTESMFFLFCSLFLVGLKENNTRLIIAGLFLASLTRATAMFFIPAVIVMEFFNSEKHFNSSSLKNILYYSLTILSALFVVVLIQYYQTHEWFAFVKQQVKFWGHKFSWPGFPLISYSTGNTLWIDGLAFITGLTAIVISFVFLIKKLKVTEHWHKNRPYWFSAVYIVMVTFYSIFFNNKAGDGQTSLDSLNRYIFSTAFFMIFFIQSAEYFSLNLKNTFIFVFIVVAGFMLIGLGGPALQFISKPKFGTWGNLIFFFALLNYIMYYYLTSHKSYGKYIGLTLAGINVILTAYLLNSFLAAYWVA